MNRLIFILLAFPMLAFGQSFTFRDIAFMGQLQQTAAAGSVTFFTEQFEEVDSGGALGSDSDGFDESTAYYTNGPTVLRDFASPTIGDTGSYSLFLAGDSADSQCRFQFAGTYNELYMSFVLQITNVPTSGNAFDIVSFKDVSGNSCSRVFVTTSGTVLVYNGTSSETSGALSPDTKYYFWHYWSSNGTSTIEFQTTNSRTGVPGPNYAEKTGGTGNVDCRRLYVVADNSGPISFIIDDIKIATGGWPE